MALRNEMRNTVAEEATLNGPCDTQRCIGKASMPEPLKLTVFVKHETTLGTWERAGVLDRELKPYLRLRARNVNVSLVTYGGREELQYSARMPGIKILCNQFGLPAKTYLRRVHQVHGLDLLKSQILKSHVTTALISALRAHWAWQVPLIVRLSFNWSESARVKQPGNTPLAKRVDELERAAAASASHIITATQDIADALIAKDPAAATKLTLIPNYVDEELFRPIPADKHFDLVYVGRMNRHKNLIALLQAVDQLGLTIAMIGSISDYVRENDDDKRYFAEIKDRFGDLNGRIHWLGRIKNEELPTYMNQARAFVLCSLIEGHSRALVEAMACGMPIIASDVFGISNMIEHERTGYLCKTDAASIAAAIESALSAPALMEKMGAKARQYALAHYSLDQLVQREYELLRDVAGRNPIDGASMRLAQYLTRRSPRS